MEIIIIEAQKAYVFEKGICGDNTQDNSIPKLWSQNSQIHKHKKLYNVP